MRHVDRAKNKVIEGDWNYAEDDDTEPFDFALFPEADDDPTTRMVIDMAAMRRDHN